MDLYSKLGNELRALFKDLFIPSKSTKVSQEMGKILAIAAQIGGPIHKEAEQLSIDIHSFLKNPKDPKLTAIMKKHALHLEQETREI